MIFILKSRFSKWDFMSIPKGLIYLGLASYRCKYWRWKTEECWITFVSFFKSVHMLLLLCFLMWSTKWIYNLLLCTLQKKEKKEKSLTWRWINDDNLHFQNSVKHIFRVEKLIAKTLFWFECVHTLYVWWCSTLAGVPNSLLSLGWLIQTCFSSTHQ